MSRSKPSISLPKKIRGEDFPSDFQSAADVLGAVYNDQADQIFRSLAFVDRDIISYTVNVGAAPNLLPINPAQIKATLDAKIRGIIVINAANVNSPGVYPDSAPFVNWAIGANGLITILKVSGLQANSTYNLTLELIS